MPRIASGFTTAVLAAAAAGLLGCANELSVRAQSKRIDELSSRTTRVEEGIDKMRERIDAVHDEVVTLSSQERKSDRELAALRSSLPRLEQRVAESEAKRARLEERVRTAEAGNAELRESHQHLNVLLAEVEHELDGLRGAQAPGASAGAAHDEGNEAARLRLEQLQAELLRVRSAIRTIRENAETEAAAAALTRAPPLPAGKATPGAGSTAETERPAPSGSGQTAAEPARESWSAGLGSVARHPVELGFLVACALAILAPIGWLLWRRRRLKAHAAAASAPPAAPAPAAPKVVKKKAAAPEKPIEAETDSATETESEAESASEPDADPEADAALESAAESATESGADTDADTEPAAAAAPDPEPAAADSPAPAASDSGTLAAPAPVPTHRAGTTVIKSTRPPAGKPAAAPPAQAKGPPPPARAVVPDLSRIEDVVKALDVALPTAEQVSRSYAARQPPVEEREEADQPQATQIIGQQKQQSPAKTDVLASRTDTIEEADDFRETVVVGAEMQPQAVTKLAMTPAPRPLRSEDEGLERPTLVLDPVEQPGMTQVINAPVKGARDKEAARGKRAQGEPRGTAPGGAAKKPRGDKELLAELEQIIGYRMEDRR